MTIRTTRWTTDTCGCIIEYQWDDTLPDNQRTHTISNVVSKCTAHNPLQENIDVWTIVRDENSKKNIAYQDILDNGPASLYDLDGLGNKLLKKGIELNFSFSGTVPNRIVTLTVVGISLTNPQRNTIQNFLNNKFGTGRVILG